MRPARNSPFAGLGLLTCTVLLVTGTAFAEQPSVAKEKERDGRATIVDGVESLRGPIWGDICLGRTGDCTLPRCVDPPAGNCDNGRYCEGGLNPGTVCTSSPTTLCRVCSNKTCTGNRVCSKKRCSGSPANTACTGSGQGTCPVGQICSYVNCTTDANCTEFGATCPAAVAVCTGTGRGTCPPNQTCSFITCTTDTPCLANGGTCPPGGVCGAAPNICSAGLIGLPCTTNAQCPSGSCNLTTNICSCLFNSHCHCPGFVNSPPPDGTQLCLVGPTCCDSCPPIGCEDVECCTQVCNLGASGVYCCEVEWDTQCASEAAAYFCHSLTNDDCEGAKLLTDVPPGMGITDSGLATEGNDPGFGCFVNNPGARALDTVWYKFVATYDSARLQTCFSNNPATDSLIQVFAVGDPTDGQTACDALIPVGCSDDVVGCSSGGKNAQLCLQRLTPGNLYYVMVASKIVVPDGVAYRLDISAPCNSPPPPLGDYCPDAQAIQDGITAFNLSVATMTAPVEPCIPTMINDLWYNYTATCSGSLTVETCGTDAESSPDTNLAIYASGEDGECLCPPLIEDPIACSADEGGNCGLGSRVVLDAVEGSCYKIRLADNVGGREPGNLTITCVPDKCAGLKPADSDFDGDVDLIDAAAFQRCYSGQGAYNDDPCCKTFDITPDGDIDSGDWAEFVIRFNGP